MIGSTAVDGNRDSPDLPGDPRTWREFRAALKRLMVRAELTALAIERISADPTARQMGIDSIADATVGRKIADKDEPVDARSVRTIVGTCGLAAARRGEALADADVHRWLQVRTVLAEGAAVPVPVSAAPAVPVPVSAESAAPAVPEPAGPAASAAPAAPRDGAAPPARSARQAWLVGLLVAVTLATAGVVFWKMTGEPDRGSAVATGSALGQGDDLVSGTPPCRNPPDKPVGTGLTMTAPTPGTMLTGDMAEARGTVSLAPGERPPWLLLYATGACAFYLEAPVLVSGGAWSGTLYFDPAQHGSFVAYAMVVDAEADRQLHEIAAASRSPFIVRLPTGARIVHVTVRCCG